MFRKIVFIHVLGVILITVDLEKSVLNTLQGLAPTAKSLLLAVSGGADSVAMLMLLRGSKYEISVAHFDHSLRKNSAKDCEFVAALCKRLNISFYSERANVAEVAKQKGWNIEDAARRLRYAFLARTAKKINADFVLVAHNQNDQVETVLLQLLRGAAYLKGMKAKQGQVIRPLLNIKRKALEEYLKQIGQGFVSDESNFDIDLARAQLRHNIIPLLGKRNPDVIEKLANLAYSQQQIFEHMSKEALKNIRDSEIDVVRLLSKDEAVKQQTIAELLREKKLLNSSKQIHSILQNINSKNPKRIDISKNHYARIAYGKLKIIPKNVADMPIQAVKTKEDLPANVSEKILKIKNLVYRTKEDGDYMIFEYGKKKLSDIFINKKIPREERNSIKLLASGKQVFWIENIAVGKAFEIKTIDYDKKFMKAALAEAKLAFAEGELPVGAVVVQDKTIIAKAHNLTEQSKDPSAHAELLAIKQAAEVLGDWRLTECRLYVTLEPCPMCFGAALQAHLPIVIYGAKNHKEGALCSVVDMSSLPWKRKIASKSGVLDKESAKLLQEFFKKRR